MPGNINEAEEKIWEDLDQVFRDGGYMLWQHAFLSTIVSPGKTYPLSSGFAHAIPIRGIENEQDSDNSITLFVLCDTPLTYLLIFLEYRIL